jgi:hypothetical protein
VFKPVPSRLIATRIHEGGDKINTRYTIRPGRMNGFYDALPIDCRCAFKSTSSRASGKHYDIAITRKIAEVTCRHRDNVTEHGRNADIFKSFCLFRLPVQASYIVSCLDEQGTKP